MTPTIVHSLSSVTNWLHPITRFEDCPCRSEIPNQSRLGLFQAMSIVRLATRAAQRGSGGDGSIAAADALDVWAALEVAYALFDRIADKLQDCETMLDR
jgi:hypothetical protein